MRHRSPVWRAMPCSQHARKTSLLGYPLFQGAPTVRHRPHRSSLQSAEFLSKYTKIAIYGRTRARIFGAADLVFVRVDSPRRTGRIDWRRVLPKQRHAELSTSPLTVAAVVMLNSAHCLRGPQHTCPGRARASPCSSRPATQNRAPLRASYFERSFEVGSASLNRGRYKRWGSSRFTSAPFDIPDLKGAKALLYELR